MTCCQAYEKKNILFVNRFRLVPIHAKRHILHRCTISKKIWYKRRFSVTSIANHNLKQCKIRSSELALLLINNIPTFVSQNASRRGAGRRFPPRISVLLWILNYFNFFFFNSMSSVWATKTLKLAGRSYWERWYTDSIHYNTIL